MSRITPGFSFAFLQECFVATLLILARGEDDDDDDAHAARGADGGGEDEGLEKYELWRVFRRQADILRKEVEGEEGQQVQQQPLMQVAGWGAEAGQVPIYPAMSGGPTDNDKTLRHDVWSRRADTGLPDLERLRVKDEVLTPLRYPSVKSEYINTAAMDHRL